MEENVAMESKAISVPPSLVELFLPHFPTNLLSIQLYANYLMVPIFKHSICGFECRLGCAFWLDSGFLCVYGPNTVK